MMIKVLPQMIDYAAKAFPEKEAFCYGDASLTYAQLNNKADFLAAYLIANGVKKGDRVGVYLFRSIETAIAIYGIMKTGAAFVPIDPWLPIARIVFLLNDCGIEYVVTNPNLIKKHRRIIEMESPLKSFIGVNLDIEFPSISWEEVFKKSAIVYPRVELEENDLAYIMYTSGSTGLPKGIMHTHKSGLSYARLSVNLFNITSTDRIASHAPLHFDISTLGYLATPLAIATTVIISEAHTKMAPSLAELIEKEKITIWYSVPLALIQLLQSKSLQTKDLIALRLILFGGEVFANKYLKQLMHLCPTAQFYNVYGPAEVNQCTSFEIKTPPNEDTIIPIGHIWEDTEYGILDENGKLDEFAHEGELIISSVTRMRGYWNNPSLTEKSFYREKINGQDKIYFKTGDIVRKNDYGELLFLGRNDRQVKVRGYRIEIDEIESTIIKHTGVFETAVVVVENENKKEIIAAIIANNNAVIEANEILKHCRNYLPSYALPERIEFMQSFPRTGSGKIDRNQLIKII